MKLQEFNRLNEIEKIQTLRDFGVLVEERLEKEDQVLVYQMQSFFTEVHYQKGYRILKELRSFTNSDHLFPYIGKLPVTDASYN